MSLSGVGDMAKPKWGEGELLLTVDMDGEVASRLSQS